MVSAKLNWAGQRFGVLAQNVANADTPDYQPKDLQKLDFSRILSRPAERTSGRLELTHTGHLTPLGQNAADYRIRTTETFETSPTGNGVVMEDQMQKLGETQLDYRMATNIYGKFKGFLRTAIGDTRA